jgi:hypothetical protein
MPDRKKFRSRVLAVAGVAVTAALIAGSPALTRPAPASAQGLTGCPAGVVVPPGETCCLNGSGVVVEIPGQSCSFSIGGGSAAYNAGWNIVAGPDGTTETGSAGPLYGYPPGAFSYQVLPQGSPLQAGSGYWAYFDTPVTETLPAASNGTVTINLTPGQWALIGNPGDGTATVSGANVTVFAYEGGGYQPTNQLAPGQGAWAISPTGGPVTITSSPGTPPGPPF